MELQPSKKQRMFDAIQAPHSVAIDSLHLFPHEWLPSSALLPHLSHQPWTVEEQEEADLAVVKGLEEMIAYQTEHPETITELWTDSIEAYIDTAFAADNMPVLRDKALRMACNNFHVLANPYITEDTEEEPGASELLTLVIYAHPLSSRLPSDSVLRSIRDQLVAKANKSLDECSCVQDVMCYDYVPLLADRNTATDDVYDLVMWAMIYIEALAIPDLKLPPGIEVFITALWNYLAFYPVRDAVEFVEGASDVDFYNMAYLLTHIGYMPTGYGRHALKMRTAPWLYRFLRANFYSVLEMGELDLVAEFVDLLRQYGCSETDDRQVRDGSRHLLHLYRQCAGGCWMKYREQDESEGSNPYDLMHKPWTGLAGLRRRQSEPAASGTYGEIADRLISAQFVEIPAVWRRRRYKSPGLV